MTTGLTDEALPILRADPFVTQWIERMQTHADGINTTTADA